MRKTKPGWYLGLLASLFVIWQIAAAERKPAAYVDGKPIYVVGGDQTTFDQEPGTVATPDANGYDIVVAGSGLAGLTSALYLSKAGKHVLILEKEDHLGGLATGANDGSTIYDRGAAYWTDTDTEEYHILKDIDPSLRNYKTNQISEPIDSYYYFDTKAGQMVYRSQIWDEKTLAKLPSSFALFKIELQYANTNHQIPNQPFEDFAKPRYSGDMVLDTITTREWIRQMPREFENHHRNGTTEPIWKRFNAERKSGRLNPNDPMSDVIGLMDLYCRSALGTTSDNVSAMAFANFYISEIVTRYTTPYGTGGVANLLEQNLRNSRRVDFLPSSTVVKMENVGDNGEEGVDVTYVTDRGNGKETHKVHGTYAVYAGQLLELSKDPKKFREPDLIPDLPEDQKQAVRQLKYSHYSVHNLKVKGHPYRFSYDTWIQLKDYRGKFEKVNFGEQDYKTDEFTDFITGPWQTLRGYEGFRNYKNDPLDPNGAPSDGEITIYHPLSQEQYDAANVAEIASLGTLRFLKLYPDLVALAAKEMRVPSGNESKYSLELKEVDTNPWPFSVHIAKPGHFTHLVPILKRPFQHIYFAHSNLGTPAFEEALYRGHCAAQLILKKQDPSYQFEKNCRCSE